MIVASAIGAAGLAAAAEPLASLVIGGGAGVPELAALLTALSVGVLAFGAQGHLVRVLAARHRAPTAAGGTAVAWSIGIVVAGGLVMNAADAVGVARGIGVGFSSGLVVGAGLLLVAVRRDAGPGALTGVLRVALVSGVAALGVGLIGHALVSAGSGGSSTGVAIAQVLAVGCLAFLVVGGAAALADPSAVRALMRVRSSAGGNT